LISASFLPSSHARADSPRSPKLRHRTVTWAPREEASAMAPPARQTKSPAWALTTRTGPLPGSALAFICCCPLWAFGVVETSAPTSRRAPDLLGGLGDQPELGPLLLGGQVIALLGRGEAALRGQA